MDYTTTGQTAKAGTDYTAASSTVTIPSGQISATATVATIENTTEEANRYFTFRMSNARGGGPTEPDETFTVTLSNPAGGGGPAPGLDDDGASLETIIVVDDEHIGDPPPINDPPEELVSITPRVDPVSIAEHARATEVTVTAAHKYGVTMASAVTVNLTWGDTATAGDYTATTLSSVTIPAGQVSGEGTLTITPIDDELVEDDETITVAGSVAATDPEEEIFVGSVQLVLVDDDTEDNTLNVSTLSVDPAEVGEAAGAIDVAITATLKDPSNTLASDKTIQLTLRGTASSSNYSAEALTSVAI